MSEYGICKCDSCEAQEKESYCKQCSDNRQYRSHYKPHPIVKKLIAASPELAGAIMEALDERSR